MIKLITGACPTFPKGIEDAGAGRPAGGSNAPSPSLPLRGGWDAGWAPDWTNADFPILISYRLLTFATAAV